jgi:hypothetical protein
MIKNKGQKCLVSTCEKDAFCKGYCTKHYQQMKFKGKIQEKNINLAVEGYCKNLGCGNLVFAKGLCQNCYVHARKSEVQNAS